MNQVADARRYNAIKAMQFLTFKKIVERCHRGDGSLDDLIDEWEIEGRPQVIVKGNGHSSGTNALIVGLLVFAGVWAALLLFGGG